MQDGSWIDAMGRHGLLSSSREATLEELAQMAALACDAPMVAISLVAGQRQWIKALIGMTASSGGVTSALCARTIADRELLVVPDALLDPRFAADPLVLGREQVRFYAGVPLVSAGGEVIGTACVMDRAPRQLEERHEAVLRMVGRQAMTWLELERKRRELAESEARFRAIAELTPDAVFLNRGGRVDYINPAGVALWRAVDGSQLLGRTAIDLFHPELHPLIEARLALLRSAPNVAPWVEQRIVALDGAVVEVSVSARSFHLGDELVVQVICHDLTEQKRAERAATRLVAIIESSDDAIMSQDRSGMVTTWNSGAESMFGYSAAEMIGGSIARLVPADRVHELGAVRAQVLAGQRADHLKTQRLAKDGTLVDLSVTLSPIRSTRGEVIGIATVGRNITSENSAEAALRESEARFRELAENIREVFWMTDPAKQRVLYISPAYEKIWGRTCASVYENAADWLDAIHEDDRPRILDAATTKQALGTYNERYRIRRPDGELRFIHDRASPVRDGRGEVLRIVGIAEDVTEQRHLEDQFRQAQKMEAVGQLAGGIAHDFNNILTAITIQADLALGGPGVDAETRGLIEEMKGAADRAAWLTRQLLAFSRRQVLMPRAIELNSCVQHLGKMLRRILGEDVELELTPHPRPLPLRADPGMLDQAVLNLAVNARDAMPRGGRLRIQLGEHTVSASEATRVPGCAAGHYVELCVGDTGEGIAPEVLPHIFEPFFTTKAVDKGTGLGLATVFGIVKQHGGWIGVTSELGVGTMFRILLPAAAVLEPADQPLPVIATSARGHETILFVEDDRALRKAIGKTLTRAGYHLLTAENGVEAIALWKANRGAVQLLYTDVVMPGGMSGWELATHLRADDPALRVLFSSGYSPEVAGRELPSVDRDAFIEKPAPASAILSAIRRRLDA